MKPPSVSMLGTHALVLDASVTKQQLADYANAILLVNNYAFAVTQQQLPVLNVPPPNYASFTTQFAPAKQHALNWTDSILPMMLQLPQTITQSASLFSLDEQIVNGYLAALVLNPTNQTALAALQSTLSSMQALVNAQITTITNIQTQLRQFSSDITTDAVSLNTIASEALQDVGTDQDKITSLNAQIVQLNSNIQTMNTLLTVSEIGMGVSIFVGLIGGVVCMIPGAQAAGIGIIALAVVGEAASIAGTVITNQVIKADQQAITADQNTISSLNQDVILLQGINTQFQALVQMNTAAQEALTTVLNMWQALSTAIAQVSTDLSDTSGAVTSANFAQAQQDMTAADAAWQEVVEFATALNGLTIQWQDGQGNYKSFVTSPVQADMATMNMIQAA